MKSQTSQDLSFTSFVISALQKINHLLHADAGSHIQSIDADLLPVTHDDLLT